MSNIKLLILTALAVFLAFSCGSVAEPNTAQESKLEEKTVLKEGVVLEEDTALKGNIVLEEDTVVKDNIVVIKEDTVSGRQEETAGLQEVQRELVQVDDEEYFDPSTITQEYHDLTMEEVRVFIDELNRVIARRNFNAWKAALATRYLNEISSPENLRQVSEHPAMTTRKIVLRTAEDYFMNVVVPSRTNSRVDAIEFISRNRVKAFTIMTSRTGETQRLRLYDLEKIDGVWKIIS